MTTTIVVMMTTTIVVMVVVVSLDERSKEHRLKILMMHTNIMTTFIQET